MKNLLSIFVFLYATLPLYSQLAPTITFSSLSTKNGLSSNNITAIVQDQQGFMWFGTTNGLCRYDGYECKHYRSDYWNPDLFIGNEVLCMEKDNKESLLISTTMGLNVLNLRTKEIKKYPYDRLSFSIINTMIVDSRNTIYLGTDNGVFLYDLEKEDFVLLNKDGEGKNIKGNYISSLYVDSKNNLWIGMWETGFCAYNLVNERFHFFDEIFENRSMSVTSFCEDKNHNIWFSTWNQDGIHCLENPFDTKKLIHTIYPETGETGSLSSSIVYNIIQDDKDGHMWVATSNGINILTDPTDKNSFVNINSQNEENFYSDEIAAIYKDRRGIIWISTLGAGICSTDVNENHFFHHDLSQNFKTREQRTVCTIYEDENEILWLGIQTHGLFFYNRKTGDLYSAERIPAFQTLPTGYNSIVDILPIKSRNEIWLASRYEGVFIAKVNEDKVSSVVSVPSIHSLKVNKLVEDAFERIWVATNEGIYSIQRDSVDKYQAISHKELDEISSTDIIKTVFCDFDKNLWVSFLHHGLFCVTFNNKGEISEMKKYSMENEKLFNNDITYIFQDTKKRLWIGTQGGELLLYNKNADVFEVIPNLNLIPDDAICSIQEDKTGVLWISTGKGLVSYNADLPIDRQIKIYTAADGLNLLSFRGNSSFQNGKGELFFGGTNGIISFSPSEFQDNSLSLSPVITNIYIGNKEIDSFSSSYLENVNLSHKENSIRIDFSSLSFKSPLSEKYAYKLDGVDKDWVYVDAQRRYAVYNNLEKGKYYFYIKSCNESGYWSQTVCPIIINRKPAPWQTTWAYLIYTLLLILILYISYRVVVARQRLRQRIEIEQMERRNSEEVNQVKFQFFTNISHELFTPITVLLCSLDELSSRSNKDEHILKTMKLNINRLRRLLQQVLEFRKAESGNLKLKVLPDDLTTFVKEICDVNFYPLGENKNISLHFSSDQDKFPAYFDPDKLDKILYNLISNAFKYTKPGGSVGVLVQKMTEEGKNYASIKVIDTGEGIAPERMPELFKRFYEGNYRRFKTTGTGIGLSLTKELVELHHGTISVSSNLGIGSEFTVTIPVDKDSFNENEMELPDKETVQTEAREQEKENFFVEKTISVLLAEDNIDMLSIMFNSFDRHFNVYKAQNGKEAIEILNAETIDIVVTDFMMPQMNGVELCQTMKSEIRWSHIPIILLTAKSDQEYKIKAFEAGADAYVTKPFEFNSLIANIKSLVKNRRTSAQVFKSKNEISLSNVTYSSVDEEFLKNVIKYVEENVNQPDFDIESLCKAMGVTQSTMYRKIKSLTNMSLAEFIRNLKIKIACKLLVESKMNISTVAFELGYSDSKHFRDLFKKEVGVTPSEYIKRHRKKVAVE